MIEPQYAYAAAFSGGLAVVQGAKGAGFTKAYIDTTGKVIWDDGLARTSD